MSSKLNQIALTMIPGLGCTSTRQLLELCPDPDELFGLSHSQLIELFGKHTEIAAAIESKSMFARAEAELRFAEKNNIHVLFCKEEGFPQRLNDADCTDTPVVLYVAGNCNLNMKRSLSVVGSRRATDYGKSTTDQLIAEMTDPELMIVSGLAYGIDTASHRAALSYRMPTVAVLGHGLDRIYPAQNRELATQIVMNGGALVTEYTSGTELNAAYFPARNRIIAALGDATLVVEAAEKGGALITAGIAGSYHREVFSVPGRLTDPYPKGCNNLIANNKATIMRSGDDLYFQMGWKHSPQAQAMQTSMFPELDKEEQIVVDILGQLHEATLDEMTATNRLAMPKIVSALLTLELKKVVRCLPGKIYKIV